MYLDSEYILDKRQSGFEPKSGHVGFVVGKVAVGTGFPANSNSTDCSILIHRREWGTAGQLVSDSLTPPQVH
jgi:hypothetical protein